MMETRELKKAAGVFAANLIESNMIVGSWHWKYLSFCD